MLWLADQISAYVIYEWSQRDQCYKPILDEIDQIFGHLNTAQRSNTNILVPGAGLGRLAFDIASQGYVCQGNEFSLFMLIASNYVLNRCKSINCCTIYPWIHQYTNNLAIDDQIKPVTFPDIDPLEMPKDANFSMIAGDFLEGKRKMRHIKKFVKPMEVNTLLVYRASK